MVTSAIRKQIEAKVLEVFSILDKTGRNTTSYQNMFKEMNDAQFETFLKKLGSSFENNFYLEVVPWESEPTLNDIKKAAKKVNLELEQYIYLRDETDSEGKFVRTRYKCPVGLTV